MDRAEEVHGTLVIARGMTRNCFSLAKKFSMA
jgi:hypothetical protein